MLCRWLFLSWLGNLTEMTPLAQFLSPPPTLTRWLRWWFSRSEIGFDSCSWPHKSLKVALRMACGQNCSHAQKILLCPGHEKGLNKGMCDISCAWVLSTSKLLVSVDWFRWTKTHNLMLEIHFKQSYLAQIVSESRIYFRFSSFCDYPCSQSTKTGSKIYYRKAYKNNNVKQSNNKLCGRPPQYAPPLASWPLTLKVVSESRDVGYICANFSLLVFLGPCSRLRPKIIMSIMMWIMDVVVLSICLRVVKFLSELKIWYTCWSRVMPLLILFGSKRSEGEVTQIENEHNKADPCEKRQKTHFKET